MKQEIKHALHRRGWHLFTDGSLPPGVDWLLDIRKLAGAAAPRTFFDVGANTGQTVAEMREAFPDARIFAFEPFRETFQALRANTGQLPGVQIFPLALGARPGALQTPLREQSVSNSLVNAPAVDGSGGASETITVETLDRFCATHDVPTIDVLKTDTEGFDLEVLRGAEELLDAGRVRFVYAEVAFCAENTRNTAFQPLYEYLTAKGFRFLGLYELYPFHHNPEPIAFCNALFVRRD